jgi:hypothetical protein
MKWFFVLFLSVSIFILSCEENSTEPIQKVISQDVIDFAHALNITQVYYDSIYVCTSDAFLFDSEKISTIEFGSKTSNQLLVLTSIEPDYAASANSVTLSLSEGLKVEAEIIDLNLTVRLHTTNELFYDLDTLIQMYKYPYSGTEIFLTYEEIFLNDPIGDLVQDFDFIGTDVYVHARGPHGIISINAETSEHHVILAAEKAPPAWNYLACTPDFIFYESTGLTLYRFNLESDTTDLQIDLPLVGYKFIQGLDFNNNVLYVFMETDNVPDNHLAKFDTEGNYLGSVSYPRVTYHMAIEDNILYAIDPDKLSRYDLSSNSFLEDRQLPSLYWDGIRTDGEYFYFADYERRIIGRVPLPELN